MKVLFAGCGSIGRRHIRNLKTLRTCQVMAWRVRNEDLGDFAREYDIEVFHDLDTALDQRPDVVFVTNPTHFHLDVAIPAAQRGCHLFLEKPLSDSLARVDELIDVCERNSVIAFVAYKMRFHKSIQKIKEVVDSGVLGKLISARSHYSGYLPKWHPWEDYWRMYSARSELGGGVVLDATHELDYLYWILGEVDEVIAMVDRVSDLEIDTEDTAEILIRFISGAIGSVHMSYAEQPEFRACEVHGTEGTVLWQQHRGGVELFTTASDMWTFIGEGDDYDANQMFLDEMEHFLACIDGKQEPLIDLQQARRVLELALEARQPWDARKKRECDEA